MEVFKPEDGKLFVCTHIDTPFMAAKAVNIYDKAGEVVNVTQMDIAETRQCFNNNPISPVVKVNEDIPRRFLQAGNRIEFVM
jgi:hypothetical protein